MPQNLVQSRQAAKMTRLASEGRREVTGWDASCVPSEEPESDLHRGLLRRGHSMAGCPRQKSGSSILYQLCRRELIASPQLGLPHLGGEGTSTHLLGLMSWYLAHCAGTSRVPGRGDVCVDDSEVFIKPQEGATLSMSLHTPNLALLPTQRAGRGEPQPQNWRPAQQAERTAPPPASRGYRY